MQSGTYLISVSMILTAMLIFILTFENRKPSAKELVILAVFCALAVAGRAAFALIPQFKPMAAIVIIAGIALGGQSGFLVGVISTFVSNFLFGQGPWTPWQMFAMGMLGFLAGIFFHRRSNRKEHFWGVCIFGGMAAVFIYGVIMDTASLIMMYSANITFASWLALCAAGMHFNLIHGWSTSIFLFFLYRPMMKKIERIQMKYGGEA